MRRKLCPSVAAVRPFQHFVVSSHLLLFYRVRFYHQGSLTSFIDIKAHRSNYICNSNKIGNSAGSRPLIRKIIVPLACQSTLTHWILPREKKKQTPKLKTCKIGFTGCFARCDALQPVMFFLQQTDASKTRGWCEETVRIQGA